jgi:hypothetical protein
MLSAYSTTKRWNSSLNSNVETGPDIAFPTYTPCFGCHNSVGKKHQMWQRRVSTKRVILIKLLPCHNGIYAMQCVTFCFVLRSSDFRARFPKTLSGLSPIPCPFLTSKLPPSTLISNSIYSLRVGEQEYLCRESKHTDLGLPPAEYISQLLACCPLSDVFLIYLRFRQSILLMSSVISCHYGERSF